MKLTIQQAGIQFNQDNKVAAIVLNGQISLAKSQVMMGFQPVITEDDRAQLQAIMDRLIEQIRKDEGI